MLGSSGSEVEVMTEPRGDEHSLRLQAETEPQEAPPSNRRGFPCAFSYQPIAKHISSQYPEWFRR